MTFSSDSPSVKKLEVPGSDRKHNGFVAIVVQDFSDDVEQSPSKSQQNVGKGRRQSRMFSIDYDFMPDYEQDRTVKKYTQIGISLAADLSLVAYGGCFAMSSIVLPQIEGTPNGLSISSEEGSWFASVFVIGSITGALAGGFTGEKLGRKMAILIDNFVMLLGLLCIALPHNFTLMLIGRYLCGHACSSLQVVVPSYTSEISQPLIRPLTGNLFIITFVGGGTIMLVVGALAKWYIAIGIMTIWPLLSFISILIFCPESPIWLLTKGKDDQAEKSLMLLRGEEAIVKNEMKRIKTGLSEMEMTIKIQGGHKSGIREILDLFKDRAFMKPFGILIFLFVFAVNWGGTPALAFYLIILLQKSNLSYDPYIMAASLSVFRSLLLILCSGFTSKMRRRPLFLTCGLFHFIGIGSIGLYNYLNADGYLVKMFSLAEWIPIISILLIYSFSTIGYISLIFMFTPELLPSYARATGCGMVGFVDNVSLSFSVKMLPTLLDYIGVSGTFFLYAAITMISLIFSYFYLPETYGLSLDEIERIFRGSKKSDASNMELEEMEESANRLRSNSVWSLYETSSQYTR